MMIGEGNLRMFHILNSERRLVEEFENRVNLSLSELQYELPLTTSWFTKATFV